MLCVENPGTHVATATLPTALGIGMLLEGYREMLLWTELLQETSMTEQYRSKSHEEGHQGAQA